MRHRFEESPTVTKLSGPEEPQSDRSTSLPSPKMDKGKAKMPKYVDSEGIESEHSPDSEFNGLDLSVTSRAKKVHTKTNEPLRCSTQEKNAVSRIGYNDYMAYHYAFMMKVGTVREPEMFSEAVKDP